MARAPVQKGTIRKQILSMHNFPPNETVDNPRELLAVAASFHPSTLASIESHVQVSYQVAAGSCCLLCLYKIVFCSC